MVTISMENKDHVGMLITSVLYGLERCVAITQFSNLAFEPSYKHYIFNIS